MNFKNMSEADINSFAVQTVNAILDKKQKDAEWFAMVAECELAQIQSKPTPTEEESAEEESAEWFAMVAECELAQIQSKPTPTEEESAVALVSIRLKTQIREEVAKRHAELLEARLQVYRTNDDKFMEEPDAELTDANISPRLANEYSDIWWAEQRADFLAQQGTSDLRSVSQLL
jgi:hypothetical protein